MLARSPTGPQAAARQRPLVGKTLSGLEAAGIKRVLRSTADTPRRAEELRGIQPERMSLLLAEGDLDQSGRGVLYCGIGTAPGRHQMITNVDFDAVAVQDHESIIGGEVAGVSCRFKRSMRQLHSDAAAGR